jgi:hypothetical protein
MLGMGRARRPSPKPTSVGLNRLPNKKRLIVPPQNARLDVKRLPQENGFSKSNRLASHYGIQPMGSDFSRKACAIH